MLSRSLVNETDFLHGSRFTITQVSMSPRWHESFLLIVAITSSAPTTSLETLRIVGLNASQHLVDAISLNQHHGIETRRFTHASTRYIILPTLAGQMLRTQVRLSASTIPVFMRMVLLFLKLPASVTRRRSALRVPLLEKVPRADLLTSSRMST